MPATPVPADWQLVERLAVPSTAQAGPGINRGGERRCFAHSPTGVLFAAVNFVAVASASPPRLARMRELVVPGPAGERLLADVPDSPPDSSVQAQVAGYRVVAYTPAAATISLAFRLSTGQLVALSVPMAWSRGDWRFVPASSSTPFSFDLVANLSGFVPWSGA